MMRRNKKIFYGFLAFFIPFLFLVILFFLKGFFEKNTVMYTDAFVQYYPLFNYLKGIINGTSSFFYSFYKNFGGTMFGTFFYYLSSPLNIFVKFISRDFIMVFFLWLIIFKISFCSLSMYLYMTYKHKKCDLLILSFSICYGLMGYNINYFVNFMWLDVVALAPIVLIGLDKLINKESPLLYIVSLFISIFSNYYISYMLCIFCVLYFLYEVFLKYNDKKEIFQLSKKFIIISLFTGLMCSFFLVPCFFESRNYFRSLGLNNIFVFDYNIFDIFSKSFIGSISLEDLLNNGSMNLYCGVIVFPLVYLFLVNKKIPQKRRRLTLLLIIFMILPCFIFPLNYVWHLFSRPNFYSYRYSFLLCFFLINIAYESYENMDFNKLHVLIYLAIYCIISFYFVLIVCFGNYYDFLSYKCIWLTLIFLFIYLFLLKMEDKRFSKLLVCFCLLIENIFNIGIVFKNPVFFEKQEMYNNYYLDVIKKYGTERLEFTNYISLNDSILFRYNGINNFLSTNNSRVMRFISQMSFKSKFFNQNLYSYQKGQYIFDSIIGLKYVVSTYKIDDYTLIDKYKIDDDNEYYVYENPNSIGIGYIINDECNNIEFKDFRYDEKIFNCISGVNHSFYKENSIKKNNNEYSSIISKPSDFYLYYPSLFRNEINLEDTVLYSSKDYAFIQNNEKNYNFKFNIDDEVDMDNLKVYIFDFDKFKSIVKNMKKEVLNYNIDNNRFVGSIDTDGGLLMITIPYEKGLIVKVDGQRVDYKEVIDTFIGINLDSGHHEITIDYSQPFLSQGVFISTLSFMLIIFYVKKLY